MESTRVAVLASIVALVLLSVLLVLGLSITGRLNANNTPMVVTIIGLVVTTVPALVGAIKIDRVQKDIRNGALTTTVKRAIREERNE